MVPGGTKVNALGELLPWDWKAASGHECCRVMGQRRRQTRSADRTMSFKQLDLWLQTVDPARPVTSLLMVDGYVTAVVVDPCSIPTDEWFAKLLGDHSRIATATGDTMTAIVTIAERFNDIGEGLAFAPGKHAPMFEETDDGLMYW